jgi:hypothetical protein
LLKKKKIKKKTSFYCFKNSSIQTKKFIEFFHEKEIQTWWWKTFFPHFQKTTEKTWQIQKNKEIQKQLFELSEKEIFERDQKSKGNWKVQNQLQEGINSGEDIDFLQIGNKDFKPFALPETLRIREKLIRKNLSSF